MIIEELAGRITLDDAQAQTKLGRFTSKLDRLGTKLQTTGKKFSLFLTAPIVAAGGAMLKTAADAEETLSKYNAVFSGIGMQANEMAKSVSDSFDLSVVKTKEMMGATGDLLTGFGFTQEMALDLSRQVTELGVDLASFTNYAGGAEGASEALTKALLGEREMVKSLGISILETDVKAKMLELRQKGMTFATERQAKAYATLLIAQEQSKNAIGDYARTQGSLSNQMRALKQDIIDLAVSLGKQLIPMAKKIVERVREWAHWFTDLDERSQRILMVLAGIAAAIGPLLIGIGSLMKAVKLATVVMHAFNTTNPVGWIMLAAAAAAGLAYVIVKNWQQIELAAKRVYNVVRDYLVFQFTAMLEDFGRIAAGFVNTWNWVKSKFTKEEFVKTENAFQGFIDKIETSRVKMYEAGLSAEEYRAALEELRKEKEKLEKESGSVPGISAPPGTPGYTPGAAPLVPGTTEILMSERSYDALGKTGKDSIDGIAAATQALKELWLEANADLVRTVEGSARSYDILGKAGEDNLAGIDAATTALIDMENKHQKEIKETTELQKKLAGIMKQSFQDSFEALGEAIVKGEEGWKSFAEVAKETIALILEALGQEFIVRAAAALVPGPTFNPAAALGYGVAAAAAFTGAGVVRALEHGGVITEPVVGRGLHSGATYAIGESGPEEVMPLRGGRGRGPQVVVVQNIHGSVLSERQLAGFARNAVWGRR